MWPRSPKNSEVDVLEAARLSTAIVSEMKIHDKLDKWLLHLSLINVDAQCRELTQVSFGATPSIICLLRMDNGRLAVSRWGIP